MVPQRRALIASIAPRAFARSLNLLRFEVLRGAYGQVVAALLLFPRFGEPRAVRSVAAGETFMRLTQASTNYVALGNLSQRSVSDNFLLKGEYDLASDLLLTGQVNYSPYESEFHPINSRDNLLESHGGGLTAKLDTVYRHSLPHREPAIGMIGDLVALRGDVASNGDGGQHGFLLSDVPDWAV